MEHKMIQETITYAEKKLFLETILYTRFVITYIYIR